MNADAWTAYRERMLPKASGLCSGAAGSYFRGSSFDYERTAMYGLKTESSFDAAHFLTDYHGKCENLHGHRWRVVAYLKQEAFPGNNRKYETQGN